MVVLFIIQKVQNSTNHDYTVLFADLRWRGVCSCNNHARITAGGFAFKCGGSTTPHSTTHTTPHHTTPHHIISPTPHHITSHHSISLNIIIPCSHAYTHLVGLDNVGARLACHCYKIQLPAPKRPGCVYARRGRAPRIDSTR